MKWIHDREGEINGEVVGEDDTWMWGAPRRRPRTPLHVREQSRPRRCHRRSDLPTPGSRAPNAVSAAVIKSSRESEQTNFDMASNKRPTSYAVSDENPQRSGGHDLRHVVSAVATARLRTVVLADLGTARGVSRGVGRGCGLHRRRVVDMGYPRRCRRIGNRCFGEAERTRDDRGGDDSRPQNGFHLFSLSIISRTPH